jgi:hypothetical protein
MVKTPGCSKTYMDAAVAQPQTPHAEKFNTGRKITSRPRQVGECWLRPESAD